MTFSLQPRKTITEPQLLSGLRMFLFDGVFTQFMGTFTGGAFLVAFALLLGASNFSIGLIAALGPFTQLLQIPTILLVEKIGNRKLIVLVNSFVSRLFWFAVAVIPWFVEESFRVGLFLLALTVYYAGGTVSNLSLTSWIRDLIPDQIRGRYVAKRMALMTAVGAALSLVTGVGVDLYKQFGAEIDIYSIYFIFGGFSGIAGVYFLSRMPEPKMKHRRKANLLSAIKEPFQKRNFRHLLIFLGAWNFAVNIAAPFFTVYMLKRLHLSMAVIIALSVLSQIVNVMFLRLWGMLADRFSNKSVLLVTCTMFVLTTAVWPFTTMPAAYFLTIPLVISIHAFAGISSAGIMLCTGNIALKLAPLGKSTAYLAVNALISGFMATIASILGGLAATFLEGQRFSLTFRWLSMESLKFEIYAMDLKGLDFLFVFSCLFGLYAVYRLLAVREQGEVQADVVIDQFRIEVKKAAANVTNIEGLLDLIYFPYASLRELLYDKEKEEEENKKNNGEAFIEERGNPK